MNSFTSVLSKILKWFEIIGLVITFFGVSFKILHLTGANMMLLLGLPTLAITYFLFAYVMVQVKEESEKPKGFANLLVLILRKVMFIGLSVYCIAFLFTILHFNGATEMMIIGLGTISVCTLISMTLVLGQRERMVILKSPLIRCLAALLLYYIFTMPL